MSFQLQEVVEIIACSTLGLSILAAIPAFRVTYRLKKLYGSANWQVTTAVVEHSSVRHSWFGGKNFYAPDVLYRYQFQGESYTSSIISPNFHKAGAQDQNWAEQWSKLLSVGTSISVFVDTKNPTSAVLFPELNYGWLHTFGVALAAYGFFSVFLLFGYLRYRYGTL